MKYRLASDLHLEFIRPDVNYKDFIEHLNTIIAPHTDDKEAVLLLAGDIDNSKKLKICLEHFSERFKLVLCIAGNHEFYSNKFKTAIQKASEDIKHLENVKILDNDFIEIDNCVVIGSTLWANMNNQDPLTMGVASVGLNDYKVIRNGPVSEAWKYKLSPYDTVNRYIKSIKYIKEKIKTFKDNNKNIIVMTHHAPSFLSISEKFKSDPLNGAYATELFEYIYDFGPDIWVHGHIHNNVDYYINDTRILCNPYGYWPKSLNDEYKRDFYFEI